jgi:ATP-dependent 26S proteasome regulatory subunit
LEEDAGFCDTISNTNEHRFDHLHRNLLAYPTLGQNEVLVVDSDTDDQPDLRDDDLLTLPATIPAYSLSFKKWGLVDVEHIEPIQWQDDIYDMLQMENTQKDMVRNIIDSHHASSTAFDDFIPGKGRGLVFLLHGPPGCGKTLTAGNQCHLFV